MPEHLICPLCGAGARRWDIDVRRDIKGTRDCRVCGASWLPADDPPEAAGPYITRRSTDPGKRGGYPSSPTPARDLAPPSTGTRPAPGS